MGTGPATFCNSTTATRRRLSYSKPISVAHEKSFRGKGEVAGEVTPHGVDVVGIVLGVVVFDDESRSLDAVVVCLMEIWFAVPGEGDLIESGRIDGLAAILLHIFGQIFEVFAQQILQELFLIIGHLADR